MGYYRAGFDIVGVDIRPQPHYPFDFVQSDVLHLEAGFLRHFDAAHASPPCQKYCQMSVRYENKGGLRDARVDLIPGTRQLLADAGIPYIIENVNGAKNELVEPFRLVGEMFDLGVHRPRWFETTFAVSVPSAPPKQPNPVPVYGVRMDGRLLWRRTDGSELRAPLSIEAPREAMGIDWLDWDDLKEAIPPAYTQFIGRQLLERMNGLAG